MEKENEELKQQNDQLMRQLSHVSSPSSATSASADEGRELVPLESTASDEAKPASARIQFFISSCRTRRSRSLCSHPYTHLSRALLEMQNCILDVMPRGFDRPVRELLAGPGHAVVSAHGLRDIAASRRFACYQIKHIVVVMSVHECLYVYVCMNKCVSEFVRMCVYQSFSVL